MSRRAQETTLNSYDLLLLLFDQLRYNRGRDNRATLARCTRVCRAWREPASYVLWRKLGSFHPLWNLLASRNFSPEAKWLSAFWQFIDAEDFVKDLVEREPRRWENFLRLASYVREVSNAACSQSELALIRALTKRNNGRSILPSLHTLVWRHAVPTETSALLLFSPSLHELGITVSRLGTESTGGNAFATPQRFDTYRDVDPLFVGLADAAPFLHRLAITGRQGPGACLVTPLLRLPHLRALYLYNQSCVLEETHIRSILENLTELEVLSARVAASSEAVPTATAVYAPALLELRLEGWAAELGKIISAQFLDAPHLRYLSLKATDRLSTLVPEIASASFASSLRGVSIQGGSDPHAAQMWADLAAAEPDSFATNLVPLFKLSALEDVVVSLMTAPCPFRDEDVLEIARAWKHLRALSLSYLPFHVQSVPPLESLRHFVDHCPRLESLTMTKLSIPDSIDVPAALAYRTVDHPLQTLNLKATFVQSEEESASGRLGKLAVARYIDCLFPNLVLRDPPTLSGMASRFGGVSDPSVFTWESVEHEIRYVRAMKA